MTFSLGLPHPPSLPEPAGSWEGKRFPQGSCVMSVSHLEEGITPLSPGLRLTARIKTTRDFTSWINF